MLTVDDVYRTYNPPTGLMKLLVRSAASEPIQALRGVTLNVDRGEVVGLLGANGAGKSTLIKSITTLVTPDQGEIRYDGRLLDPDDPWFRRQFGLVLPDDRSYYWRLTGRENLEFAGVLAGLDKETAKERATHLLEERGLADRDKMVFGYSSGMKAQLGIARALIHEPDLLLLDEPTRSLDPIAAAEVCDQLRSLASQGRAVLLANHRLDEVIDTCDRVVVLVTGQIMWSGPTADLGSDATELRQSLRAVVEGDPVDESPLGASS